MEAQYAQVPMFGAAQSWAYIYPGQCVSGVRRNGTLSRHAVELAGDTSIAVLITTALCGN